MVNLKILNCEANEIKEIPSEISKLINLKELDFSMNQLETIDPGISGLQFLHDIYLGRNNAIKKLPQEIGNLIFLKYLDISNTISDLPLIKNINIKGSKIRKITKSIIPLSKIDIRRYSNLKDYSEIYPLWLENKKVNDKHFHYAIHGFCYINALLVRINGYV